MKAIILGGKERVRRLDANQSCPAALERLDSKGKSAMDWIMSALKEFGVKDVIYVGGYHVEKVIQGYPFLHFYYHENWERGSDIEALLKAEEAINDFTIILKSNIIFRKRALELLCNYQDSYVIGGVNGGHISGQEKLDYKSFYEENDLFVSLTGNNKIGLSRRIYHFSDMMFVPDKNARKTLDTARRLLLYRRNASLMHLVEDLKKEKECINVVDITEHWSSLHKSLSLAKFVLGTKAQTLERLYPVVKKSIILPQVKFSVEEWEKESSRIIPNIQDICGKRLLVIRSSALGEDSWSSSQAGKFHSELNVDGKDRSKIISAVEKVLQSYDKCGDGNGQNQILIQQKLENIKVSGVLFTRDLANGAPYYIINYDQKTQRTDTVTSGQGKELETKIIYRNYKLNIDDGWIGKLIFGARELEELLAYDALDIEFAIDVHDNLYLFQIRPLVLENEKLFLTDEDFEAEIRKIKEFVKGRFKSSPYSFGNANLLGEMPDWNPSEMIGNSPKPLSLSLYQKLITDRAWAEARAQCNYKKIMPEPLMFSLAGKPYIDVRNSFSSFIPFGMKIETAEKLVNHSIDYLKNNPAYHDKVEFEVMLNCYDFDFKSKAERLIETGFTESEIEEIRNSYLEFTNDLVVSGVKSINEQLLLFEFLCERRQKIIDHRGDSIYELPWQINGLLHDCVEYGVIPFSILARYAFIGMIILRTLVKNSLFTNDEYETFLKNIPTVATYFNRDLEWFQKGKLTKGEFLERYGHLRPNSYDISSLNYEMMLERSIFFNGKPFFSCSSFESDLAIANRLWESKKISISSILKKNGFSATSDQLFNFITQSLIGREKGKFEFTKNLNLILEKVAKLGLELGFNRDEMSYISIEKIIRLATDSPPSVIKREFERTINYEKKRYNLTTSLRLPFLINSVISIECFDLVKWFPNYVTTKMVSGEVVDLTGNANVSELKDKIVLIQNADPGYDWIFSKSILGIITQYGGSGSHMAIRAAEFGIAAAIGCGDVIFEDVRKAKFVELDCGKKTIRTKV